MGSCCPGVAARREVMASMSLTVTTMSHGNWLMREEGWASLNDLVGGREREGHRTIGREEGWDINIAPRENKQVPMPCTGCLIKDIHLQIRFFH